MKIVIRYKPKTGEMDWFSYPAPGPVPPIIDPPEPDEPKDSEPPPPPPKPS